MAISLYLSEMISLTQDRLKGHPKVRLTELVKHSSKGEGRLWHCV